MRIVFMGTPGFALPSLQALLHSSHEVVGVVTQPDRPKGRGRVLTASPIKEECQRIGVPFLQPVKMKDPHVLDQLLAWKPEAIVVVAFGRILPQIVLDIPPIGCINVHASLLPKYRGAGPIQWALIQGERETGITIMEMDAGMDTGGIYVQKHVVIHESDTAETLSGRLAHVGSALLLTSLVGIQEGSIPARQQNHEEATMAPLLRKEDGLIHWNDIAKDIHNKIRGMNPWPGAYTFLGKERWVVWRSTVKELREHQHRPGTIIEVNKEQIDVATREGIVSIREVQPANKRRMVVENYIAGHPLEPGMVLTESPAEE